MEKYYSSTGLSIASETNIRYGQEEGFIDVWKKIIGIDNIDERKKQIDKIITSIESDKDDNGFISRDEAVEINKIGNSFRIDDIELYYSFFEMLKLLKDNNPNEPDSRIVFHAVNKFLSSIPFIWIQ